MEKLETDGTARFEASKENQQQWLRNKIEKDHLEYVRKLETDIVVYTEKYETLKSQLEKTPPKLASKLKEAKNKLSLYKFKVDQAQGKIENADSLLKQTLAEYSTDSSAPPNDFFFFNHASLAARVREQHKKEGSSDFSNMQSGSDPLLDTTTIETSSGKEFKISKWHLDMLYDHQVEALHWLLEQHAEGRGSLLGDEMGLGKTITTLSLISCLAHNDNMMKVLLVCPATLQDQWKAEAKLWTPKLKVYNFTRDIKSRSKLATILKQKNEGGTMLIITYESLRNYFKWFENFRIFYAILDEGHKIKNPQAKVTVALKKLDIDNRLILTGTPIQNTIEELWCLMDFIQPGKLSSLKVFKDEYCTKILKAGSARASNLEIAMAKECTHRLRVLIRPHILRRTKAMLTKSCSLQSKNEYIVFCEPSTPQILITMKLRDQVIHRTKHRSVEDLYKDDLSLISRARKISNHPYFLFWDEAEQKLAFDVLKSNSGDLIKNKSELANLVFEQREKSGKFKIIEKLLSEWHTEEANNKVLIFSQTKIVLDVLSLMLEENKMEYKRIDGSTTVTKRMEIINEFSENKDCYVMLLTTRVGGLGLNLTAANKIIIFDPDWNPMVDIQASDRAARIGQKQDVTVYRLVLSDTVEEFIYHKQIFKQFMADKILNNPSAKRIFKNKIFWDYLISVPKKWKEMYKEAGINNQEDSIDDAKTKRNLIEAVNFNFGEIKEIVMQAGDRKRDKKNMHKLFNKDTNKIVEIDRNLMKKDKKFNQFYKNVVSDIKALDKAETKEQEQESQFIKSLLVKQEENERVNNENLTLDERIRLLELKNEMMKSLAKTSKNGSTDLKVMKSSLAYTEDEIEECIECARNQLKNMFDVQEYETDRYIPDSEIKETFSYYLSNPYFKAPFTEMLCSVATCDDYKNWHLKSNL